MTKITFARSGSVRTRLPAGFTLVEMMLVLVISLMLMTLVTSVFSVTTRTVSVIQRKLAVYAAARDILDLYDAEIRGSVTNERGELFCLKSASFMDTDPFTPMRVGAPNEPRFHGSLREADAIHFLKMNAAGLPQDNWNVTPADWGDSYCYPNEQPTTSDVHQGIIRTQLQYAKYGGFAISNLLKDVEAPLMVMRFTPRGSLYKAGGKPPLLNGEAENEFYGDLSPGHEEFAPYWCMFNNVPGASPPSAATSNSTTVSFSGEDYNYSNLGVNLMDLAFSYWDDGDKAFNDLPKDTGVYFAPPPKAMRVIITVCDPQKRVQLTLSRVVQLWCGIGDAHLDTGQLANPDTDYLAPYPYNRTKNLKILDPALYATN